MPTRALQDIFFRPILLDCNCRIWSLATTYD